MGVAFLFAVPAPLFSLLRFWFIGFPTCLLQTFSAPVNKWTNKNPRGIELDTSLLGRLLLQEQLNTCSHLAVKRSSVKEGPLTVDYERHHLPGCEKGQRTLFSLVVIVPTFVVAFPPLSTPS